MVSMWITINFAEGISGYGYDMIGIHGDRAAGG
jgi:hypothetical protein